MVTIFLGVIPHYFRRVVSLGRVLDMKLNRSKSITHANVSVFVSTHCFLKSSVCVCVFERVHMCEHVFQFYLFSL